MSRRGSNSSQTIPVLSTKAAAMSMESFKYVRKPLLTVLQEDWKAMFYDEDSKDFTLTIGAKREKLRVHKLVLLARCENLKRAILPKGELTLPTLDTPAMRKILQYLYTAEIDISNALDVSLLLKICHKLGLPSLGTHLMQSIGSLLTPDNVCCILTSAHEAINETVDENIDESFIQDMWSITNLCLQFASKHKSAVLSSDGFLDMSQDSMIIFVSAKLQVSSQELLKAVLRWARNQVGTSKLLQSDWTEEERENVRVHIEEVVKHIHVADGRMSPDSVTDGIYGILERYSWAESSLNELAFPDSSILIGRLDLQAQLNKWCGYAGHRWTLLYRGSRDGFSAHDFHSRCDNHSPTVVIVKSIAGHIFGGYSDVPWSSVYRRGKYVNSHYSFLYSLLNPFTETSPKRFEIQQSAYAINNHPQSGPIFGSGADLCISSNCHSNEESYSNFPTSYSKDKTVDQYFLASKKYFVVKDYEVFGIVN